MIIAFMALVACDGDKSDSAGFMWSIVIHGSDPYTFESTGCDFDGTGGTYTPSYDLSMQNFDGDYETFDFGDNAYVVCDATTVACAKKCNSQVEVS